MRPVRRWIDLGRFLFVEQRVLYLLIILLFGTMDRKGLSVLV